MSSKASGGTKRLKRYSNENTNTTNRNSTRMLSTPVLQSLSNNTRSPLIPLSSRTPLTDVTNDTNDDTSSDQHNRSVTRKMSQIDTPSASIHPTTTKHSTIPQETSTSLPHLSGRIRSVTSHPETSIRVPHIFERLLHDISPSKARAPTMSSPTDKQKQPVSLNKPRLYRQPVAVPTTSTNHTAIPQNTARALADLSDPIRMYTSQPETAIRVTHIFSRLLRDTLPSKTRAPTTNNRTGMHQTPTTARKTLLAKNSTFAGAIPMNSRPSMLHSLSRRLDSSFANVQTKGKTKNTTSDFTKQAVKRPHSETNITANKLQKTGQDHDTNSPTRNRGSLIDLTNGSTKTNVMRLNIMLGLRLPISATRDEYTGNTFVQTRARFPNNITTVPVQPGYKDLGDPVYSCQHCKAIFWYDERIEKKKNPRHENDPPLFPLCCKHGKIKIPLMREPPHAYKQLLYGQSKHSKAFCEGIRRYNNGFGFTSMGGQVDNSKNDGKSPPCFKIHGENYHRIGTMLPNDEYPLPQFAQLYFYDTENEIDNRMRASKGNNERGAKLKKEIFELLKLILDDHNELVQLFRRTAINIQETADGEYKLKLVSRRSSDGRETSKTNASDVAVLIVGDFTDLDKHRDIVVNEKKGGLKRISELNTLYLPLQYPLIYLEGEDGYRDDVEQLWTPRRKSKTKKKKFVTMLQHFCFRLQERIDESPHLMLSRRLLQQFIVDAYTMIESYRLTYLRNHQAELRCDSLKALDDALARGDTDLSGVGQRIRLPPSFVGGPRFMIQNYHDAMGICRWLGYPNLFITFTCNPKWPEIDRFVKARGLTANDRPDVQCRIFHMKLANLMNDIRVKKMFGETSAAVYTIENQGRGLPHAHILIWVKEFGEEINTNVVDKYISAEIPDKESDPEYYKAVNEHMIHGPCGEANKKMSCMDGRRCTKHYPKKYSERTEVDDDGYVVYRRRNDGRRVPRKGIDLDNRWVVPHNRELLMSYRAHINVEYCNRSRSIKYLFKYVHKGNDRATAAFYKSSDRANPRNIVDEIQMYYDCRYLSSTEAIWRTYGYEVHFRDPSVIRLGFHLENAQNVVYNANSSTKAVLDKKKSEDSMFTAWLKYNKNNTDGRHLTYAEFPLHFVWQTTKKTWKPRQRNISLGRLYYVYPGAGELYYLRILLNVVRGCGSYEDIRKYKGVTYESFKAACIARGLLDDDIEFIKGLEEASLWGGGRMLRTLFVDMLTGCTMTQPDYVWDKTWQLLSEDLLHSYRSRMGRYDINLRPEQLRNLCLLEIEKIMVKRNRSLSEYPSLPYPDGSGVKSHNQLIDDELAYDKDALAEEHNSLVESLNHGQKKVYDTITTSLKEKKGGVFFVYGYGGTGKTFVWRTLSAAVRSKGKIVLNVASSGIASLLLPGGRTAHSRFNIPLEIKENSMCRIKLDSDKAKLIEAAELIIWDEAPMTNRHAFEALDKTLRDIMGKIHKKYEYMPFGGKVIVFGGDFRQILPVVPKGTRNDVVRATINSSPIWKDCKVLRLTENMRLKSMSSSSGTTDMLEFSNWLTSLGDGTLGGENDGYSEVEIPEDMLINNSKGDLLHSIVDSTYPDFKENIGNVDYLQGRAILAPTLEDVDKINEYMISLDDDPKNPERIYLSADSLEAQDRGISMFESMHSVEYLNQLKFSGLPNHELKLKVGVPVMLMRNINPSEGLCNGTRLVITKLGDYVVEGQVIGGNNHGDIVWIPRMTLCPSDSKLPFKFERRQFPLIRAYAMTINKSQGQSLSTVGVFLKKPVFTHGQLYVAASRVTNRNGLKFLCCDQDENVTNRTTNVVYKEVFQNL